MTTKKRQKRTRARTAPTINSDSLGATGYSDVVCRPREVDALGDKFSERRE